MSFLTDLSPTDRIELHTAGSIIVLKAIKRTGSKVRLSIDADQEVKIRKIDQEEDRKLGNQD
jgi:hypothetical protein